jgi:hypothetical protein
MAITRRNKANISRRQELQEIATKAFEEGDMESLNNAVAEAAAMEPLSDADDVVELNEEGETLENIAESGTNNSDHDIDVSVTAPNAVSARKRGRPRTRDDTLESVSA